MNRLHLKGLIFACAVQALTAVEVDAQFVSAGGTIAPTHQLTYSNSDSFRNAGGQLFIHDIGWDWLEDQAPGNRPDELIAKWSGQFSGWSQAAASQVGIEFGYSDNPVAWSSRYTNHYRSIMDAHGVTPKFIASNGLNADGRDVNKAQAYIDNMRLAVGPNTVVASIFTPNGGQWTQGKFTSSRWSLQRDIASRGGGIVVDAPPTFWKTQPSGYQNFLIDEVKWANGAGKKSYVILSPGNGTTTFLADTQTYVRRMEDVGAIPSQWIVENYQPIGTHEDNPIGSESVTNNVHNVALWVQNHVNGNAARIGASINDGTGPSTPIDFGHTARVALNESATKNYTMTVSHFAGDAGEWYTPNIRGSVAGTARDWAVQVFLDGDEITGDVLSETGFTFGGNAGLLDVGESAQLSVRLTPFTEGAIDEHFSFNFSAFAGQGAEVPIASLQFATASAVPEPACVCLIGVSLLLGRRRRVA